MLFYGIANSHNLSSRSYFQFNSARELAEKKNLHNSYLSQVPRVYPQWSNIYDRYISMQKLDCFTVRRGQEEHYNKRADFARNHFIHNARPGAPYRLTCSIGGESIEHPNVTMNAHIEHLTANPNCPGLVIDLNPIFPAMLLTDARRDSFPEGVEHYFDKPNCSVNHMIRSGFFHNAVINPSCINSDYVTCMWNGCNLSGFEHNDTVTGEHKRNFSACPFAQALYNQGDHLVTYNAGTSTANARHRENYGSTQQTSPVQHIFYNHRAQNPHDYDSDYDSDHEIIINEPIHIGNITINPDRRGRTYTTSIDPNNPGATDAQFRLNLESFMQEVHQFQQDQQRAMENAYNGGQVSSTTHGRAISQSANGNIVETIYERRNVRPGSPSRDQNNHTRINITGGNFAQENIVGNTRIGRNNNSTSTASSSSPMVNGVQHRPSTQTNHVAQSPSQIRSSNAPLATPATTGNRNQGQVSQAAISSNTSATPANNLNVYMPRSNQCSICMDKDVNRMLSCGHSFCDTCIAEIERTSTPLTRRQCSFCRQNYDPNLTRTINYT